LSKAEKRNSYFPIRSALQRPKAGLWNGGFGGPLTVQL
jgi:hypothetical protein